MVYLLNTIRNATVCAPEGDQLFNSKARREAIEKLRRAVARHEAARREVKQASVTLHGLRLDAASEVILDVESYVNLLAKSPKEFDTSVAEFRVEANRFQGTVKRLQTQAARTTRSGPELARQESRQAWASRRWGLRRRWRLPPRLGPLRLAQPFPPCPVRRQPTPPSHGWVAARLQPVAAEWLVELRYWPWPVL